MNNGSLARRTVLVVEDEPLIALDICDSLQGAGATVLSAHTLSAGLRLAGHPDLSVAVIDFGLSDGDGTAICERLKQRSVPFVLHSGYRHTAEACGGGIVLPKQDDARAVGRRSHPSLARQLAQHAQTRQEGRAAGAQDRTQALVPVVVPLHRVFIDFFNATVVA
jgi:CheY-like chemotaxis protein